MRRRGWPTTAAVTGASAGVGCAWAGAGRARVDRPALRDGAVSLARARSWSTPSTRCVRSGRPGHLGPPRSIGWSTRPPGSAPGGCGPGRRVLDVVAPRGRRGASRDDQAGRRGGPRRRGHTPRAPPPARWRDQRLRGPDAVPTGSPPTRGFTNPRRPETTAPAAPDSARRCRGRCRRDGAADGEDPQGSLEDGGLYDQRLGAAFVSFLEAVDPQRLSPCTEMTTVLVTVQPDQLLADPGGHHRRRAHLRRAGTPPGVHRRDHPCRASTALAWSPTPAAPAACSPRLQRRSPPSPSPPARADGCDIPAAWCARPTTPADSLAAGGRTDPPDGLLHLPFHHHRAHDVRYDNPTPARRTRDLGPTDVRARRARSRPRQRRSWTPTSSAAIVPTIEVSRYWSGRASSDGSPRSSAVPVEPMPRPRPWPTWSRRSRRRSGARRVPVRRAGSRRVEQVDADRSPMPRPPKSITRRGFRRRDEGVPRRTGRRAPGRPVGWRRRRRHARGRQPGRRGRASAGLRPTRRSCR